MVWNLLVCSVVWVALPANERVLRRAAVLYAVTNIAVYLIPNALGGNVGRLGQYSAGPVLACVLLPARRGRLVLAAIPLLFWQWFPAADAIAVAAHDPSTHPAFFKPLLDVLAQQAGPPLRVEIPITKNRWEAAYVADKESLARGWETQYDLSLNRIFYDGTLDPTTYQQWLADRGVSYVALPAAPLDDSSLPEAKLLRNGLPYLSAGLAKSELAAVACRWQPGLVSGRRRPSSNSALTTSPRCVRTRRRLVRIGVEPLVRALLGAAPTPALPVGFACTTFLSTIRGSASASSERRVRTRREIPQRSAHGPTYFEKCIPSGLRSFHPR